MADYYRGNKEYFPGVGKIKFEGKDSDNDLAFKFYDENKIISGKTMKKHLRFATAYWHSFCADGSDPFGNGTIRHPWKNTEEKADAAFEFFSKLGTPYYCFHDIDASEDADSIAEYEDNYKKTTEILLERQNATGVKLLWNTANVFSHPRYMNGASTNPDFRILARAATQVKASLDANVILGGENYVFWGGREGYSTLLNTNMKKELNHMAQFLALARDYGRKIGFKGSFLIEPKPMEPTKHQYDVDSATVIGFLKEHGLDKDFKLNIEANHATLAGHSFDHELRVCADAGMLGSVDANRGDPQNGWDTDQFPTDVYDALKAMMVILDVGGLGTGGLNFDAKVRRNSTDSDDLFYAHIGGMDTFACALEIADKIIRDGKLKTRMDKRYESFTFGKGLEFEQGKMTLENLRDYALHDSPISQVSGKQELIENIMNQYMFA
ncbi:MAG: xylose isomerase [Spirochaetaceae bacterium]|nr:xylose isomerase [Spirochaetaceae bacterium]